MLFLPLVLKFKRDLLFILGFLLLPLVLYWPVTVGDKTLFRVVIRYHWQQCGEAAAASDPPIPHKSLLRDVILQMSN